MSCVFRCVIPSICVRSPKQAGRSIIEDTRQFDGWIETPQSAWVRSYLCAPLRARDQVVGFFNLDSASPNSSPISCRALDGVCRAGGMAIENARLYEETQRRLQDQSLLYEAGQAISSTLEFNQVLETMSPAAGARHQRADRFDPTMGSINGSNEDDLSTDSTAEGLQNLDLLEKPFAPTDYLKWRSTCAIGATSACG